MSGFTAAVDEARHHFVESLRRLGWEVDDEGRCWGEVLKPGGRPVPIKIELTPAFPFAPPAVFPWDGSGTRSWHQNGDGSLCVYSSVDSGDLPWLDAQALIDRIVQWFEKDEAGWPNDPPDLDLERYFDRTEGMVVYQDDLRDLIGRPLRLAWHGERLEVELGGKPRKGTSEVFLARADDLGELEHPVRDWATLAAILGKRAGDIESRARQGTLHVLLLRYTRGQHEGAVALRISAGANRAKPPTLRAMSMARADANTLRLRSGHHAERLAAASVVLVGLGAVGSVIADLLARSGLSRIVLVDGDRLRPGNSVRHLAPARYWGRNKARAVAEILEAAEHPVDVDVIAEYLTTPQTAEDLLLGYDLLIDATANSWTQELIAQAASHLGRPALSVYLQRDGGIVRVDRWPTTGDSRREAVPALPGRRPERREGGCADPVSPAPPWSAVAAATRCVAAATRLLSGDDVPATIIDVLEPQPDPPFDTLKLLC